MMWAVPDLPGLGTTIVAAEETGRRTKGVVNAR